MTRPERSIRRTHGAKKEEALCAIECTAGGDAADEDTAIFLSNAAYNALAKLSIVDLIDVEIYIREVVKIHRERAAAILEE